MIFRLLWRYPNVMLGVGAVLVFTLTLLGLHFFKDKLPADEGREFAVDGKLSKGKPRGAGIVFVVAFVIGAFLFAPFTPEYLIYILLVGIEMMTGYLDDRAKKPWGRLKKGLLDLLVSLALAFTYLHYNGNSFLVGPHIGAINIPLWLYYIIIVAVSWLMINAVNCADGVDGLSGTLTIITLLSFYIADLSLDRFSRFSFLVILFQVAILAYLWMNAGPSILMMGDAGSRAMGIFISIVAFKSGMPILLIPFALVLIVDGAIGLFKVTIIKLTKNKDFMKKLRTPIHDHVRKNLKTNWSNNQCVMRFAIVQSIISLVVIYIFIR